MQYLRLLSFSLLSLASVGLQASPLDSTPWAFDGANPSLTAAASVAGHYAVASDDSIEVRDINQQPLYRLGKARLAQLLGDQPHQACGLGFTPSGRYLFAAFCREGDDSLLAFNTNTGKISLVDRRDLGQRPAGQGGAPGQWGIAYFQGQLYLGSETALLRYRLDRNSLYQGQLGEPERITAPGPINGIAMEMLGQQLFASTPDGLWRLGPKGGRLLPVVSGQHFITLTMGRVFGMPEQGGLFVLQNNGKQGRIWSLPQQSLAEPEALADDSLVLLAEGLSAQARDLTATADGALLLLADSVQRLTDPRDPRLGYHDWLEDELASYLAAIKSLIEHGDIDGTSNLIGKPGMLMRAIVAPGVEPSDTPIADNVGWALFLLMAIDQARPDPDIEPLVELLIQTHAGLNPHGHGGVRTVDGHFVRVYGNDGLPRAGVNAKGEVLSQPQVYVSMKFLPAAFKAAELYPDNPRLQQYKEYLRQLVVRSSDTVKAEQRITWTNDDHGPLEINNRMSNETWIFGDIGAAQDPYATEDYANYSYQRSSFRTDRWLQGEPVILASHAAFIVNGATLILNHHFDGEGWLAQNRNYYGVTMAATDEMGAPYFAAFSAGNHPHCPKPNPQGLPCGGYYNDGPSDHPNNLIHFPAVLGFGQHGFTSPSVGAYMAYRDGRRQRMHNASGGDDIQMLTRWSHTLPNYRMRAVGIADFWYGGIGLVETLKPGTIAKLRGDFYRPQYKVEGGQLLYSNMTPRRVIGIDADGLRTDYGFQMSPFDLPRQHAEFEVIDPQGDWVELEDLVAQLDGQPMRFTNPHFERGLTGWEAKGTPRVVDGVSGKGVVLSAGQSVSQALDLSLDFDKTRFLVQLLGFEQGKDKTAGQGQLRLRWSSDGNPANLLPGQESQALGSEQAMLLATEKPEGGNFLHIELLGEQGQVRFENLVVLRRGAQAALANGDFAQGERHWQLGKGAEVVTTQQASVGERALRLQRGPGMLAWQQASRTLEVGDDPLGTRYLLRFDAETLGEGFKLELMMEAYDKAGNRLVERRDIGDIRPGHSGERTVTFRKRPDYHQLVVTWRLKRRHANNEGEAVVYIDNLRLDKERVWLESDCVEDSPTACLPTRLQRQAQ
ncbi:hypothetical protein [Ferrimonas marina]|uniref:Uncharacterized protein n=1 Tax=Ferrimonas marina TaxID=299255 RepID=A0A1M5YBT9_9GAMM|nr:hypothetical protein [Ferrimonas marina]SHI09456.1 hypothetical protein SAMN02745129_4056 [Ferrimonas marina]